MDIEQVTANFTRNNFLTTYFATAAEAADYLDKAIDGTTVGFGDSETLLGMHLVERLSKHNKEVLHPMLSRRQGGDFQQTALACLHTEIFLTSVNGASETGCMVNIDARGNRVAGSLFGHKKVYFVFGVNKLRPTLEEAIARARNIASPLNVIRHGLKTPCAIKKDKCYDCASPERLCNALVVYYKKMKAMEMEVVIIGEELGY